MKQTKTGGRIINYDDPEMKENALEKTLDRLPKGQHLEGKAIIRMKLKCALERVKMVRYAQFEKEPTQKQYFLNRALELTNEYVYAYLAKDWNYTIEKIIAIEQRTLDAIADKLTIAMPFGAISKAGGI